MLPVPSPTEIRAELEAAVLKDLLGPVGGPDEEVDEPSVRERYLVSIESSVVGSLFLAEVRYRELLWSEISR